MRITAFGSICARRFSGLAVVEIGVGVVPGETVAGSAFDDRPLNEQNKIPTMATEWASDLSGNKKWKKSVRLNGRTNFEFSTGHSLDAVTRCETSFYIRMT